MKIYGILFLGLIIAMIAGAAMSADYDRQYYAPEPSRPPGSGCRAASYHRRPTAIRIISSKKKQPPAVDQETEGQEV